MLEFKRLDFNDMDWSLLDAARDRTIFQTRAWLEFVSETQGGEPMIAAMRKDGETVGYFTGILLRRFGINILGSPFPGWTTSYMGFNLLADISRSEAFKYLLRFAFQELKCQHVEVLDRGATFEDLEELDGKIRRASGFEIDLRQDEEAIFGRMTSACRRCIRQSTKREVTIEESHDMDFAVDFHEQLKDVFAKQNLVPTYPLTRVQMLIHHILPTGNLLLLRARDPEGRCIATGIFPAMNDTMFFWGGASWREHQFRRPNEAIQWYAMRYWKDKGISKYDMCGSGEYKRKYGAEDMEVPWFRKSKHRGVMFLRDSAKNVARIRQKTLGGVKHQSGRMKARKE